MSRLHVALFRFGLAALLLGLVLGAPAAVSAAGEGAAGCTSAERSACAWDPGVTTGKRCVSQTGCATCRYTGVASDECFYSGSGTTHITHYLPE